MIDGNKRVNPVPPPRFTTDKNLPIQTGNELCGLLAGRHRALYGAFTVLSGLRGLACCDKFPQILVTC